MEAQRSEAHALAEEVLLRNPPADAPERARSHFAVGTARIAEREYIEAETHLRRALMLSEKGDDQELLIRVLRSLVQCALLKGDPELALTYCLRSLRVALDAGDAVLEADARMDIGAVYRELGDFESALGHLLACLRRMGSIPALKYGQLLCGIGRVYQDLEENEEALNFFESALEAFRSEGNIHGEGLAYVDRGRARATLCQHEDAVSDFKRGVEILSTLEDTPHLAPALATLGGALAALDRHEEAQIAYTTALSLIEGSPAPEYQKDVLLAAARYELSRGLPDSAIATLSRLAGIISDDEVSRYAWEMYALLAEAHEQQGDLKTAIHCLRNYQRVRQAVCDVTNTLAIRGLMLQFDVEQARQREETFRLQSIELARANEELQFLHTQLEERNRVLEQISNDDPLTGLKNRRYLWLRLSTEVRRARRHQRPLCAMMCDIDHFKAINDRFTHTVGDAVLSRIGGILRDAIRTTDIAGRYGGDEFTLLLTDTDLEGATMLAERLREAVSLHPWSELAESLAVTLSVGVTQFQSDQDVHALISAADSRLYEAKRAGRNQVMN
jgi:diguanylate cyclase (GGDEF)-like protein